MVSQLLQSSSGRMRRGVVGVGLALVALLAINAFADSALRQFKFDVTEEGLYTLSDSTRQVLSEIEEPITVRLFFSSLLAERSPAIKAYRQRIAALLEQYADLADGQIRLEYHDPEPFSLTEDRAVAFGLEGFPITDAGDRGYFGIAATNSTDDIEVMPFVSQDREAFIEYDLTKMIHALSDPDLPTIGILSSLPLMGGEGGRQPMALMEQMRAFFKIEMVPPGGEMLPDDLDALMIVHPRDLPDPMIYAIDQFVMGGGRVLMFADPVAEVEKAANPQGGGTPGASDANRLLNAWGLNLVDGVVAGDLETARRVSIRVDQQVVAIDYVGWLALGPPHFDVTDTVMGELSAINMATAGVLEAKDDSGLTVTPLIRTSDQSMRIDASKFTGDIDAVDLFNSFQPSGEPLMLAARVAGSVESLFPDGPPDGAVEPEGGHLERASAPANIIVVADVDMLSNQMWLDRRALLGQTIDIPLANNADFVVNALDNLAGNSALIGLRGRASASRPFQMIEDLRREAERTYRAREQDLQVRLAEIEEELGTLVARANAADDGADVVISDADREKIDRFRAEMLEIRADLRAVRHALREDIESLNDRIKLINIALVPALLTLAALVTVFVRRRRRRVRVAQA